VSRKRPRGELYKWVAISVAIHVILLLLPAHIFQALFPPRHGGTGGGLRDLTPDFAEVAIAILRVPAGPVLEMPEAEVELEAISEIDETPQGRPASNPAGGVPGEGSGAGDGVGDREGPSTAEPIFFPARPRLIVPPAMEDLDIESLRVDLRILVNSSGIPEEVIIPDSLAGSEIGRRLQESALRFRFEPARKGDLPVTSWVDLPLLLES
jgi:hypothetical protein